VAEPATQNFLGSFDVDHRGVLGNERRPAKSCGSLPGQVASKLTLEELGIRSDQSSRWQRLAALPKEKQEEAIKNLIRESKIKRAM
jgi:hypothetical protein